MSSDLTIKPYLSLNFHIQCPEIAKLLLLEHDVSNASTICHHEFCHPCPHSTLNNLPQENPVSDLDISVLLVLLEFDCERVS